MEILVLSNGHGEDQIAAPIVEALQTFPTVSRIVALPLVGEGYVYQKLNIPIIGTVKTMPSGGFNQNPGQLWRDVQGGLLALTYHQYQTIRQWGKTGGKILAVGDIVPLFLAWLSGADYSFVGTAKSEYYLRDETGWLPSTSNLYRWLGSMYFPWERWLMTRPNCRGVFPRDTLTTKILQQWKIPVFDLGNPMMDGLSLSQPLTVNLTTNPLIILLLPGSRMPEAQRNWQIILEGVQAVIKAFSSQSIIFLAAIAPSLNLTPFQQNLMADGWIFQPSGSIPLDLQDAEALTFTQNNATLILTQQAYRNCLQLAQVGMAMAGTATEQFVGLGKPALTFPGEGPQFTPRFARSQNCLLGCSVTLVDTPKQAGNILMTLLNHPQKLQQIAENGRKRLGNPGAGARIAECLVKQCFRYLD
ncbi:lipid-A-disaccharide synthase-related protein [Crocosphaera sp. UHCC 0190]|uniref:lipid-A-disaccharide synthase-related protein n=1 Tax=Crocosphaera sp. UHCC 0190 TaxID=3110246 RepID=UPI002B1F126B|nr:lipid-A-disaccharide synthase-related protein [Crocosphaera sp. UHCC 0190]MEA5509376.1 lipid-A-disaccharide synthase-related protein [Crocosphaera sp. UHCC 0190]